MSRDTQIDDVTRSIEMDYEDMRCDFIVKKAHGFINKIKDFTSSVKDTITNKELPRQVRDEAFYRALEFFKQAVPTTPVSLEEPQPADEALENTLSRVNLKDELAEIKKELYELRSNASEEKERLENLTTEQQRMESAHAMSVLTLDKNLSSLRTIVLKNKELLKNDEVEQAHKEGATGEDVPQVQPMGDENVAGAASGDQLPKPVEFPAPVVPAEPCLDVKLEPKGSCKIKKLGETASNKDILIESTAFVIKKVTNGISNIKGYDFKGVESFCLGGWTGVHTLKSIHGKIAAFSDRCVITWKIQSGKWVHETVFRRTQHDIACVTDLKSDPKTIAVATNDSILCVEKEKVCAKFSIPEPPKDILSIDEDTLLIFDASGFLKLDLHTEKTTRLKTVPEMKTVSALATWIHGYFFALDPTNEALYLLGDDMEKVQQIWSIGNQLRDGDELEHFSVSETKCLCVTKSGFVLHFDIKYEKKQ